MQMPVSLLPIFFGRQPRCAWTGSRPLPRPPPPTLTSSPKVGDGPQLMVLSSAATMILLFLQTGRDCHQRGRHISSPGHHDASCRLPALERV